MKNVKELGYIRRSHVKEAEDMYCGFLKTGLSNKSEKEKSEIINKQHEAIQYLKERQK